MATKIEYKKTESSGEALEKVKAFITPEYLAKFQVDVDLKFDEKTKKAIASGKGFTLSMNFFEKHCDVDLELSLLLRPLKSKIMEKIEHQIAKNL